MKKVLASLLCLAFIASQANAATIGQLGILQDTANGGINPATGSAWKVGDTYRLIFLTSTTTTAASTEIADYNAFVQSAANAAGYGSVDWFAIGSTLSVTARANTGTTAAGGVAFFDFNSTLIANNNADLWDSSIATTINYTELGDFVADTQYYTGSDADGEQASNGDYLGTTVVRTGQTVPRAQLGRNRVDMTNQRWMIQFSSALGGSYPMLAMSEELTVVPEPASVFLLIIGLIGLFGVVKLGRRGR